MRPSYHQDYFGPRPSPFQTALTRVLAFLDARSTGEWLAFGAGLVLGLAL